MSSSAQSEITQILLELQSDKVDRRVAADRVFELVYDELRHLASSLMRDERTDHTLQATALVNEAYIRLVDETRIQWQNRAHFFGIAARAMRRCLAGGPAIAAGPKAVVERALISMKQSVSPSRPTTSISPALVLTLRPRMWNPCSSSHRTPSASAVRPRS